MPAARQIRTIGIVIAGLGLAAAGCETSPAEPGPLDGLPRTLTLVELELIDSANGFGLGLFERLVAEADGENLAISPLSAFMALGMATNGAAGETYDAMRATLQLPATADETNQAYHDLIRLLRALDPSIEIELANSIWYRAGLPASLDFLDASEHFFDARIEGIDFDDPETPTTINDWVSDQTRGRITGLIESIKSTDLMFLINAVYFKGRWAHAFDAGRTAPAEFRTPDGGVEVRMMSIEAPLRSAVSEEFTGVDLRYGRGAFSMTLLLPPDSVEIGDFVGGIDEAVWDRWMAAFSAGQVSLHMPRFSLEWSGRLNTPLADMGMGIAFDDQRADFSRLVEDGLVGPGDLFITEVKQKSFVEVTERGTEAAAATSVGIGTTSAPLPIRFDRPFVFAIRERFSGTILFLGVVTNPLG